MNKIQTAKVNTKLQRKIDGEFIHDIPGYEGYHGIVTNLVNGNVYRFMRYDLNGNMGSYYVLKNHSSGEFVMNTPENTKCNLLWGKVTTFGSMSCIKIFVSQN